MGTHFFEKKVHSLDHILKIILSPLFKNPEQILVSEKLAKRTKKAPVPVTEWRRSPGPSYRRPSVCFVWVGMLSLLMNWRKREWRAFCRIWWIFLFLMEQFQWLQLKYKERAIVMARRWITSYYYPVWSWGTKLVCDIGLCVNGFSQVFH